MAASYIRLPSVMPSRPLLVLGLLLLSLLLLSSRPSHAAAPLAFNNLFSSNMVLQRAPQQAAMWGYGEPASKLIVAIDGSNVNGTTVNADGHWQLQLPAYQASLNHTIALTDGTTTLTLRNVVFGDVYLCSGQSNMQVTLNYSFGGAEAMAASSNYPNIRLFNIPPQYSNWTVDQATITYPEGWVLPSASTLQNPNEPSDTWSYFSATCYWTGLHLYDSLNGTVPIGLLQASYGGTCVAAWTSNDTNTRCGPIVTPVGTDNTLYNRPSVLYNAMIHPILPIRLRAVLWYQGETDWWDPDRYKCSFPNMIEDWRAKFNTPYLPFYFVELAPYNGASYAVREAQKQALLLPMTGVANAIDLGDRTAPAGDVHPRNKSFVGERLSLLLQRNLYGQQVEAEAPLLLSAKALVASYGSFFLTLHFSDDNRSQHLFALATPGCDSSAKDARACCVREDTLRYSGLIWYSFIVDGRTYTVNSTVHFNNFEHTITTVDQPPVLPTVGQPVTVSHAYVDWPGCALYNRQGLPALPFNINVTVQSYQPLAVSSLFSSNMVLQRGQLNTLWGTGGPPGTQITVLADGVRVGVGGVSDRGEWWAEIRPRQAATNVTLTISDNKTTVTLTNVAFGDVYLCSGQSNMQVVLNYSFGGAEAIAVADKYPNIRLFNVPSQWSNTPSFTFDQLSYTPSWQVPSADTLQAGVGDVWSYFSAVCWWTGTNIYDSLDGEVPIGLIQSSVGGTCVAAWNSYETNTRCGEIVEPPPGSFDDAPRNQPSFLYNAMINPLRYASTRLTAVLWYQAEEDNWAIDRYYCAFPNLITDWRKQLDAPELPFYFVQLAPYTWADPTVPPLLRDAQLSALQLPLTGVANTIDLGDFNAPAALGDIHPRNKSYVGERLARWVRRDVYEQQVAVWGPQVADVKARLVNGSTQLVVTVAFASDATSEGLFALGTPGCANATRYGCCTAVSDNTVSDGLLEVTYPYLERTVTTSGHVTIDTAARTLTLTVDTMLPKVGAWLTVAYAWQMYPGCALYNRDRLPALAFQSSVTIAGELPSAVSAAEFRLNNLFSNNMVLQRAPQQAAMWGYGEPGRTVTVRLDDKDVASTTVSDSGEWSVQLPATDASLDRSITASDGNTTLTLRNVAFGDVYLCSGQSNMMIVLNYSFGGPEAMAAASKYPHIRLFNLPMQLATVPRDEATASYSPDSWVLPSADTLQYPDNWQDVWDYFSGVCYWTAVHLSHSLNGTVPLGLVHSSWGGTCIHAWTSADTNTKCGPLITPPFNDSQNQPSVLYNAMIHPLTPMRLTAVLWYQGESDDFDVDRYACSFPNMIADWRSKFGYEAASLPFYFALLAPFADAPFVGLREAQYHALQLPMTGVANTIDLGDVGGWMGSVHPRNKSYVGERFARLIRRDVYGQQVAVAGPQVADVKARLDSSRQQLLITVAFTADSSDGLFALPTPDCTNSTSGYGCCMVSEHTVDAGLVEFQYATKGGNVTATGVATIDVAARTLSVAVAGMELPMVGQWVVVSYAWEAFPGCALYNQHRLPALPFRVNVSVQSLSAAMPLRLNNFFSNNMVLQRAPQQAVLWGYGEPGRTVSVQLDREKVNKTVVLASGDWSVQLPATEPSLFKTVVVDDGATTIELQNVAFGDVYLCGGQSNMHVTVGYSFGGAEAIAAAGNYTNIRLFSIEESASDVPLNESSALSYTSDSWVYPSNTTLQLASDPSWVWSHFSAVCYWTGVQIAQTTDVPIGLVSSSYGGTAIQSWTSPDTNYRCGPLQTPGTNDSRNQPSAAYNAMIHPILPMRFRAVLWYQGESDDFDVDRYKCSFPNMITEWRAKFSYDAASLPFYFVVLAPWGNAPPRLRQAQLSGLQLSNVGAASAIDLGDKYGGGGDAHPRNKSFVGERLARWVRRDIYGQHVYPMGPESLPVDALSLKVHYDNNVTTVALLLTYPATDINEGLYVLPTPDCDTCCQGGAGVLLVTLNDTSAGNIAVYRPAVSIDQQALTLAATFTIPNGLSNRTTVTVGLEAEPWPQCVLYNKHGLPALPSIITVPLVAGGGAADGSSVLRLNNYFSSSMVLQRDQQAVVWGYGEPGHNVTVYLDGQNVATAVISTSGDWSVKLPATSSSLNRNVTVSDTVTTITLTNVAFGDVYLCSGQSNMQITMNYSFGGAEAIAAADKYPNIRLFNIGQTASNTTLDEGRISFSPNSWVYPATDSLQAPWSTEDVWSFFSATCYWTGMHIYDSLNGSVPLGLVHSSYGGTVVSAWTSPDTNTKCGPLSSPGSADYDQPSALYNAMIHPLLPMRLRAVLWYQGESDWYDIDRYKCSFPNMIADWRSKFGYDVDSLPFYFVLLSPYTGANALLRQAQLSAWHEGANVGVASAIDLGDASGSWGNIHPRNKSYVGERLARWVRRDVYKQQVAVLGPEPIGLMDSNAVRVTSASSGGTTNMTVVVTYSQTDVNEGLYVLPSPDCTTCCQNGAGVLLVTIQDSGNSSAGNATYRPAVSIDDKAHSLTASFIAPFAVSDKATATVWLEAEPWPQCVLYNKHGLPALPFISTVPLNLNPAAPAEESSHTVVYVVVVVVLLIVVAVLVWLGVRYAKKRRASGDADVAGYRNMDTSRNNLLDDVND